MLSPTQLHPAWPQAQLPERAGGQRRLRRLDREGTGQPPARGGGPSLLHHHRHRDDQGRRVGFPARAEPQPDAQLSLPQPRPLARYPAPQSLDLPTTTRKPAPAPAHGPTPSRSEGRRPLERLPLLPRAHSFQRTWGQGSTHPYSASPETQARPPGPKDNTLSPGTRGRARSWSPQLSHPPSRLEVPK